MASCRFSRRTLPHCHRRKGRLVADVPRKPMRVFTSLFSLFLSSLAARGGHSRTSKENLKTFLVTVLGLVGGASGGTETIHRIYNISEFS